MSSPTSLTAASPSGRPAFAWTAEAVWAAHKRYVVLADGRRVLIEHSPCGWRMKAHGDAGRVFAMSLWDLRVELTRLGAEPEVTR